MDSQYIDVDRIPIDIAIKQTYGRFQVFTTIVYSVGFCMGAFFTFAFPLLELYPQFECFNDFTQTYEIWSRETAWTNSKWRVDRNSDISINNWITELNLYWVDKWQIGLFGSLYYLGYFFGSVLFVNLSDVQNSKFYTNPSTRFH